MKPSERTSAWIESEVEAYMEARIAERDQQPSVSVPPASPDMRMGEVMRRTGLNSSTIYELIRKGAFPKWAELAEDRFRLAEDGDRGMVGIAPRSND